MFYIPTIGSVVKMFKHQQYEVNSCAVECVGLRGNLLTVYIMSSGQSVALL